MSVDALEQSPWTVPAASGAAGSSLRIARHPIGYGLDGECLSLLGLRVQVLRIVVDGDTVLGALDLNKPMPGPAAMTPTLTVSIAPLVGCQRRYPDLGTAPLRS
jgi:hypothetical protein